MIKLTAANEDYLEAVFELCEAGGGSCRLVDVARKLDVSKASVNKAMTTLKEAKYIEQPYYGDITLTEDGRKYGGEVLGRHHALFSFLHNKLGVDKERAEEEACSMEHAISEDTMQRWIKYMKENG